MSASVLVAEPNPQLRLSITASLQAEGLDVDAVGSLLELPRKWSGKGPSVLLLAGELAENRTSTLLEQFRSQGWTGSLLLVGRARSGSAEQLGADHSLPRPLVLQDLISWLSGQDGPPSQTSPRTLQLETCVVDLSRQTVSGADGSTRRLTTKEAEFLAYLAAHPGRTVSRDELLEEVWGYQRGGSSRVVDKMLTRLRAKIGDDAGSPTHIFTVYGGGYRFEPLTRTEVRPEQGASLRKGNTNPATPVMRAPADDAALRSTPSLATASTSFVGRDDDLADLGEDLSSGARLVTILGPGGAGKTRLARHYAASVAEDDPPKGGVWFVDLCEVDDRSGMLAAICSAIDLPAEAAGDEDGAVETLGEALAERGPCLIVLDNFEQIVRSCASTLDTWLRLAPEASFIVTAREPLRIGWERCFELEPLSEDDAVALFLARARTARRGFSPAEGEEDVVRSIVNGVDRLPLAIELAAARVTSLTIPQIAQRLEERMGDVLRSSRRDVAPRQATLWNAVDWSWELLSRWEQEALCQCSVFRGGFFLSAAESVLDLSLFPDAPPTLDAVEELVRKSLLRRERHPNLAAQERFALYAPVRDYAEQRLESRADSAQRARARHQAWALSLGGELVQQLRRGDAGAALLRLQVEQDNLREVFRRSSDAPRNLVQAALALDALYAARGPASTRREVLDKAIEASQSLPAVTRARVLQARGRARQVVEPYVAAETDLLAAVTLAAEAGDPALLAEVTCSLGNLRCRQGLWKEAVSQYRAGLDASREAGDRHEEARILARLGTALQQQGRIRQAAARYREALRLRATLVSTPGAYADGSLVLLDLGFSGVSGSIAALSQVSLIGPLDETEAMGGFASLSHLWGAAMPEGTAEEVEDALSEALEDARASGDLLAEAMLLASLGVARLDAHAWEDAERDFRSSVDVLTRIGHLPAQGAVLGQLGRVLVLRGELDEGEELLDKARTLLRRSGDQRARIYVLGNYATLLADTGRPEPAARAIAKARGLAKRVGDPLTARLLDLAEAHVALARADGDQARLDAATEGRKVLASNVTATGSVDLRIAVHQLRDALRAPRSRGR